MKLAALEIPYDEGDSTEGEVGDTDEHQANSVESNSSRRLLNTHGCSRLFIVKGFFKIYSDSFSH